MVTAVADTAGVLCLILSAVIAALPDNADLKAVLVILAVGLAFLYGGLRGLREDRRRRCRNKLGAFLMRGEELTKHTTNDSIDWNTTKAGCIAWGNEVGTYIEHQLGVGPARRWLNDDGLPMIGTVPHNDPERSDYQVWCHHRCARLSDLIGQLT